jgi:hypothetical protein
MDSLLHLPLHTWGGFLVSLKSMGATVLVFFGGYLYLHKSAAPAPKCEIEKETSRAEANQERQVASLEESGKPSFSKKNSNAQQSAPSPKLALPTEQRKFRTSYGRNVQDLVAELEA